MWKLSQWKIYRWCLKRNRLNRYRFGKTWLKQLLIRHAALFLPKLWLLVSKDRLTFLIAFTAQEEMHLYKGPYLWNSVVDGEWEKIERKRKSLDPSGVEAHDLLFTRHILNRCGATTAACLKFYETGIIAEKSTQLPFSDRANWKRIFYDGPLLRLEQL